MPDGCQAFLEPASPYLLDDTEVLELPQKQSL